jgi:hypothetical protein
MVGKLGAATPRDGEAMRAVRPVSERRTAAGRGGDRRRPDLSGAPAEASERSKGSAVSEN